MLQYTLAGASTALLPWLLAACGDDDDDEVDPTATSEPTPTEDAGDEPTATDELVEPTATEEPEEPTATETAEEEPTPTEEPSGAGDEVIVYSGRSEELVGPLLERFEADTGITARVLYAGTAELAATLLEEGGNTPADLYFAQDAGALGAVARAGMLATLPDALLEQVESRFRSPDGVWIGLSGRARTVVYNRDAVSESDMPESILGFTDPVWNGRLGWAPTNGSFQAFVTALRVLEGEDVARDWLTGVRDNGAVTYSNNTSIVQAAIDGEIDAGFVNNYYLLRFEAEAGGEVAAGQFWYTNGDPGALVNVAGAGIIDGASNREAAELLLEYMLSDEGQQYFADETFEYPLVEGVETDPSLVPLSEIQTPDIDLSDLDDLEGTLRLLTEVGLI